MNIEMLEKNDWIIFRYVSGSISYGTNTPESDVDKRGVFLLPLKERITLKSLVKEVGEAEPVDIKYYELSKFMELASECNPTIIEFLFAPPDCIEKTTYLWQRIVWNRHLFISKKAHKAFSGYASAQISKSRGQHKMANCPELAIQPVKEDFCWFIPDCSKNHRPVPIKIYGFADSPLDLKNYHVSALEHVQNTYRMYYYGDKSKGIFRGDDMLVCESIPIEDEESKFAGLLIYNQHEYEKALKEHKRYNEWVQNRNPERWMNKNKEEVGWDVKNMQHCMRLLLSGENILRYGEPIIRFEGEQLKLLKDIRNGVYKYDEIMAMVNEKTMIIDQLYETSTLPEDVDIDKIDALYKEIAGV